ncbi:PKD domain-containing protein [uncultured Roseibium sp.]|uniref:PKD domain-containing protein n=1 Tax=uncultured Roseibium sp. TaxID=1936171 RepID=UPI0032164795
MSRRKFSNWLPAILAGVLTALQTAILSPVLAQENPAEEKVYQQAYGEIKQTFDTVKGHFDEVKNTAQSFQGAVTTWRNATTYATQNKAIKSVNDLYKSTIDKAAEGVLTRLFGEDAVKELKKIQEITGVELPIPPLEKILRDPKSRKDALDYMYKLSAIERDLRNKGYFQKLKKAEALFETAGDYIGKAGDLVDFVALFDPNNVDPNSPISTLNAIDGVIGKIQDVSTAIPGFGHLLGFYREAIKVFSTELTKLDKQIAEARAGSLCGQRGRLRPHQAAFEQHFGKAECLSFLPLIAAEGELKPARIWRNTSRRAALDSVFVFVDASQHAGLTGAAFDQLYGSYNALKYSDFPENRGLVGKDRFLDILIRASGRDFSARDRECTALFRKFSDRQFRKVVETSGVVDRSKRIRSARGSVFNLNRTGEREFHALCLFDSSLFAALSDLVKKQGRQLVVRLDIVARDGRSTPDVTAIRLNGTALDFTSDPRTLRGNGRVTVYALAEAERPIAVEISAPGFESYSRDITFEAGRKLSHTAFLKRLPEPPVEEKEKQPKTTETPAQETPVSDKGSSDDPKASGSAKEAESTAGKTAGTAGAKPETEQTPDTTEAGKPATAETGKKETSTETDTARDFPDSGNGNGSDTGKTSAEAETAPPQPDPSLPTVELSGPTGTVFLGSTARIGANLSGLDTAASDADCIPGSGPFDDCRKVTIPGARPDQVIITDAGDTEDLFGDPEPQRTAYRVLWHATPNLTFDPVESGGDTTVTFDRLGTVKVWAQIVTTEDGGTKTVAETEVQTVEVLPPALSLLFDPPSGAGAGTEVRARVMTEPHVPDALIDVRWLEPATANRREYAGNGSEIGFTVDGGKTVTLEAIVRLPVHGDEIGRISGQYDTTAGSVRVTAKARGPKPQIWDENVGGLIDVPEGLYAAGQAIELSAELEGAKSGGDVRWDWTVNSGTSISNPASRTPTVSRAEAGTIQAEVTAKDKDGRLLGKGRISLAVVISADETKTAGDQRLADEKMAEADAAWRDGDPVKAADLATQAAKLRRFDPALRSKRERYVDGSMRFQNAAVLTREAEEAVRRDQLESAVSRLTEAQRLWPDSERARRLAELSREADLAKAKIERSQRLTVEALKAAGRKDFDLAIGLAEENRALMPGQQAESLLADIRKQQETWEQIQADLERKRQAAKIPEPCTPGSVSYESAGSYWKRGLDYLAQGVLVEGIKSLEKSIETCPDERRAAQVAKMRTQVEAEIARRKAAAEAERQADLAESRRDKQCIPGGGKFAAAHRTWASGVARIKAGDVERGLMDLELSLSYCPDDKRAAQLATLKQRLDQVRQPGGQEPPQSSATTPQDQPVAACAPGGANHAGASELWQSGLAKISAGRLAAAIGDMQKSLKLCPDDQRSAQVAELRRRLTRERAETSMKRDETAREKIAATQPQTVQPKNTNTSPTSGTASVNIEGVWVVNHPDRKFELTISQTGNKVTASHQPHNARWWGTLSENRFAGTFANDWSGKKCNRLVDGTHSWGRFELVFEGDTFRGYYNYCEDGRHKVLISGKRKGSAGPVATAPTVDDSASVPGRPSKTYAGELMQLPGTTIRLTFADGTVSGFIKGAYNGDSIEATFSGPYNEVGSFTLPLIGTLIDSSGQFGTIKFKGEIHGSKRLKNENYWGDWEAGNAYEKAHGRWEAKPQ